MTVSKCRDAGRAAGRADKIADKAGLSALAWNSYSKGMMFADTSCRDAFYAEYAFAYKTTIPVVEGEVPAQKFSDAPVFNRVSKPKFASSVQSDYDRGFAEGRRVCTPGAAPSPMPFGESAQYMLGLKAGCEDAKAAARNSPVIPLWQVPHTSGDWRHW